MGIGQRIQAYRRSRSKYIVTIVLVILVAALMIYAGYNGAHSGKLDYAASLDLTAATVNGNVLTLRDTAFYVAYEEASVQELAIVYDPEDTTKYWNVHVEGIYVRVAARDAAIQMAIHDEIFYQMAMEDGIELSEEEEASLLSMQTDFWSDLEDSGGADGLGVSQEELYTSMRKICYAQKYQSIYAEMQGVDYEDYDFSQGRYEELLEQQDYEINESVWKNIAFGSITINHE